MKESSENNSAFTLQVARELGEIRVHIESMKEREKDSRLERQESLKTIENKLDNVLAKQATVSKEMAVMKGKASVLATAVTMVTNAAFMIWQHVKDRH